MSTEHNIQLTASEMAMLWTSYMNNTMAICVIKSFLSHNKDTEIKPILDNALNLGQSHIKRITDILTQEQQVIPLGFNDKDVNLGAPRLFFDSFYLIYIQNMGKIGIINYSVALSYSTRVDILAFYTECLQTSIDLYNKATAVMASKGILSRAPYHTIKNKLEFVKDDTRFFSGLFGMKKTLLSVEIAELYNNIQRNILGEALLLGFSQVAQSHEVRKYMVRGKDISKKHITHFTTTLNEDNLPTSMTSDFLPTDSMVPPYSDKLMMFHTTSLIAIGAGNYGRSLSLSTRSDLQADYARLIVEIGSYAKEGTRMMIHNGWLEQPPKTADREALANI